MQQRSIPIFRQASRQQTLGKRFPPPGRVRDSGKGYLGLEFPGVREEVPRCAGVPQRRGPP